MIDKTKFTTTEDYERAYWKSEWRKTFIIIGIVIAIVLFFIISAYLSWNGLTIDNIVFNAPVDEMAAMRYHPYGTTDLLDRGGDAKFTVSGFWDIKTDEKRYDEFRELMSKNTNIPLELHVKNSKEQDDEVIYKGIMDNDWGEHVIRVDDKNVLTINPYSDIYSTSFIKTDDTHRKYIFNTYFHTQEFFSDGEYEFVAHKRDIECTYKLPNQITNITINEDDKVYEIIFTDDLNTAYQKPMIEPEEAIEKETIEEMPAEEYLENSEQTTENRTIKALEYPRSFAGNEAMEVPDSPDGYYECIGSLYYNCNNRWFIYSKDEGWGYDRIVVATLGNNTNDFFTSEDYQEWMKDVYGADPIKVEKE